MLPGLYSAPWYNGQPFEEEDFFSNKRAFIVGLPRLRQLRIKPGIAIRLKPKKLNHSINSCLSRAVINLNDRTILIKRFSRVISTHFQNTSALDTLTFKLKRIRYYLPCHVLKHSNSLRSKMVKTNKTKQILRQRIWPKIHNNNTFGVLDIKASFSCPVLSTNHLVCHMYHSYKRSFSKYGFCISLLRIIKLM